MAAILLSHVADALLRTLSSAPETGSAMVQSRIFSSWVSSLFWFIQLLWHSEQMAPTYPFYGTWAICLIAEGILLCVSLKTPILHASSEFFILAFRSSALVALLLSTVGLHFLRTKKKVLDEEIRPLLATQDSINGEAYGSCNSQMNQQPQPDAGETSKISNQEESGSNNKSTPISDPKSLWAILAFLKTLFPFFWPSGKPGYQLLYAGIGLCLLVERVMNIMIPLQLGLITNLLSKSNGVVPWKEIVIFVFLRLLNSSGGLSALRTLMWMPLEDLSYEKVSTTAFNHTMSLSCDFHDGKSSGAVWQTIARGQYIKDVVNHICFFVIPTIVDLALAVSILYYLFDAYMALVTAAVTVMFLWTSGQVVDRQKRKRKSYVETRSKEFTILCESTDNWKTVSYFNRIPYENSRYRSAVSNHLKSRVAYRFWDSMENTVQSLVLLLGLMAACFIAAYEVASGAQPIGSFVMLLSYWAQLSAPLQSLANGFGVIVRDMVDAEELLGLLRQKPTIVDIPNAKPLVFEQGCVEFKQVGFSYDGKRKILGGVSFRAPSGQTTAIVGKTGGGKSTILKLLCRLYDPTTGTIHIDGQNISRVTTSSLRDTLGVVPQDPVLFRDTIMANIRYAKLDATDEEIINACKAVALDDKIKSFPDGYDTLVGERGVKLSGGELQRVAIARAMIKNPKIVLLDEATSSVDSETEIHVQRSLKLLCAGRTTIVIAHRLSTIMNADQILVVNDGAIVESGTHSALLKRKGYYHRLCSWQGFIVDATMPTLLNDVTPPQMLADTALGMDPRDLIEITPSNLQCAESLPDGHRTSKPSKISPQMSVNQPEVCEHCGCEFGETVSVIDDSRSVNRPGRSLKPEAPEFIPRALQNYGLGTSRQYYLQENRNPSVVNQRYTSDQPPSGYASDTGESVEIRTGREKSTETKADYHDIHGPTCAFHPNSLVTTANANKTSSFPHCLARNQEGVSFHDDDDDDDDGETPLTVENNLKNRLIRRTQSKSEPPGLMIRMNGDTNSFQGDGEPTGSAIGQNSVFRTDENSLTQHRRRRRRTNWKRRREMRTSTLSSRSTANGLRYS
ncbi:hypothetical protein LOZ03_002622 [Ophidiomyces ophidiicola]|nr:hypothetical protein LOZ03_002622 [Ophidiomyces ophidiicola]